MAVNARNHSDYATGVVPATITLPPELIEQLRRSVPSRSSGCPDADEHGDSDAPALRGYALAHVERIEDTRSMLSAFKERIGLSDDYLEENPPYLFRAEISSDRLDAYYTHMDPLTTLPNFAADARAGVSFLNSHRWGELGFGKSFDGIFNEGTGRRAATVTADFYTIPDLQLNSVSSNDLIRGIESGIVSDVSVGFGGGDWVCDLCGLSLMSWDCVHYPGMKYDEADIEWLADNPAPERAAIAAESWNAQILGRGATRARKKKAKYVTATAMVVDARLHEVSAVYDGATPGASILKAQRAAEQGRIAPEVLRFVEQRYRIRFPDPKRIYPAGISPAPDLRSESVSARQESCMEKGATAQETTPALNQGLPVEFASLFGDLRGLISLTAQAGAEAPSDAAYLAAAVDAVRRVPNLEERVRQLEAENAGLQPLAAMGTRYREVLTEECIKEGVRALGAAFNVDSTRRLLENQSIDVIQAQYEQFKAVASARFPGGSVVQDGPPVPDVETLSQRLAVAAYQA